MVKAFKCTVGQRCFRPRIRSRKYSEGQVGMQAADHVKFRGSLAHALLGALPDFFEGESVGAGRVGLAAKGAEFAMGHADVGGIDVAIDVEVADIAVALLANVVGEPAEG